MFGASPAGAQMTSVAFVSKLGQAAAVKHGLKKAVIPVKNCVGIGKVTSHKAQLCILL